MLSASALRNQIETALAANISSALSPSPRISPSVTATGIRDVDAILEGGLASAAITELVGSPCSGRTSMALFCVSAHTQKGNVCAWIDASDSLDPESAAAAGVDLERLLWVRCGSRKTSSLVREADEAIVPTKSQSTVPPQRHTGGGSPHPRSEGRDMPEAIRSMLEAHGGLYDHQIRREKRIIGTPGAPNRPLTPDRYDRMEQVSTDRLPPRRGDNLAIAPRCSEMQPRRVASRASKARLPLRIDDRSDAISDTPWQTLDQALRTADLLLQSGGFSVIVLDLGGISPEVAWRIPLATWFRFRAACERTRVSLLLLTQHPCARSSAEHVVRMQTGTLEFDGKVMTGILYHASVERRRDRTERIIPIRKPPQSEGSSLNPGQWRSNAAWAQSR